MMDVSKMIPKMIAEHARIQFKEIDKRIIQLLTLGHNLNDIDVIQESDEVDMDTMSINTKLTIQPRDIPTEAVFIDRPRGSGKTRMIAAILKEDPDAIAAVHLHTVKWLIECGVNPNQIIQYSAPATLLMHLKGRRYSRLYLDEIPRGPLGYSVVDLLGRNNINYTVFATFA